MKWFLTNLTKNTSHIFCFTLSCILSVSANANKNVTCTAEQKIAANQILKELEADTEEQASLLLEHMPFGMHVSPEHHEESTLYHGGYIANYSPSLKVSIWASYKLTATDLSNAKGKARTTCFRIDPRLKKGEYSSTTDYREPLMDQGHITNDASLRDELFEQLNTYVMSNIAPQYCTFNRGIFLTTEHLTRKWARQYDTIWVTTGSIFDDDGEPGRDFEVNRMKSNNGNTRVAVPSHYFHIVSRRTIDNNWLSISLLLPHNDEYHGKTWAETKGVIAQSITDIETIEAMTDIDLFAELKTRELVQSLDGSSWAFDWAPNNMVDTCR